MNNAKTTCNSCGLMFESGNELERNLNQCPQCIEKTQDEMLRQMFGTPNSKQTQKSTNGNI